MKGENYLYFNDVAGEPDGANKAFLIPTSSILGINIGNATDEDAPGHIYLRCKGFTGATSGSAAVLIAVKTGKHREAMDDLVAAINSNPGDGFVVIADVQNKEFVSPHIVGCAVDSAV